MHAAYASGVDVMLWVCAAIAIAAAVLAALFLPQPEGTAGPRRGRRRHARGDGLVAGSRAAIRRDRMTGMTEVPVRPDGLRERKKAKTRAAIRQHALRLFREQGYSATTIEQIADAAEVSPATFFRYFPTKEDVVLQDDLDIVTLAALEAQPRELSPDRRVPRARPPPCGRS